MLIVVSVVFRYLYFDNSPVLYFHTVSALGNFGIGGLLASSVFNKKSFIQKIIEWSKGTVIVVYMCMFLSIIFYHQLMELDIFRVLERLIYSIFFAYFILEQSMGKHHFFQCGNISAFDYRYFEAPFLSLKKKFYTFNI